MWWQCTGLLRLSLLTQATMLGSQDFFIASVQPQNCLQKLADSTKAVISAFVRSTMCLLQFAFSIFHLSAWISQQEGFQAPRICPGQTQAVLWETASEQKFSAVKPPSPIMMLILQGDSGNRLYECGVQKISFPSHRNTACAHRSHQATGTRSGSPSTTSPLLLKLTLTDTDFRKLSDRIQPNSACCRPQHLAAVLVLNRIRLRVNP